MSARIPKDHQIDLENWRETEQRILRQNANQGRGEDVKPNAMAVVWAVIVFSLICWALIAHVVLAGLRAAGVMEA